MNRSRRWWIICVLAFSAGASANAGVTVGFEPNRQTVTPGQLFTVKIFADIPEPVIGWGLDVDYDSAQLALSGHATIGPLWAPAASRDGDGLAGLSFPDPVSGTRVLLATLTFSALTKGSSELLLGMTSGDLTEGFALYPSGFADATFTSGQVTVLPEPTSAVLLVSASMLVFWRMRPAGSRRKYTLR